MRAKDLMQAKVWTVYEDDKVEDLLDVFVGKHIHGAPVLDRTGRLVGVVTQQDILLGSMTRRDVDTVDRTAELRPAGSSRGLRVRDIMTSPAVSATEDTDIKSLCRLMWELRIHRVPITRDGKIAGIVSSLDICGAIAQGKV
jgi:CBS domain-containing protein